MLIVNEPELVEALNRLRGEWAERSGGEFTASQMTWNELNAAKQVDADVIVFPSRYLGDLCVRQWLRPVRANVLESDDLKWPDVFPLVRNELVRWGSQVMALPLGIDQSAIDPPTRPPTAISWLAVVAPRAISNDRLGVLFDSESMKPRITEPPFVESLLLLQKSSANPADRTAERGRADAASIPVIGNNDRLIGVTATSHNAASAFKLLQWLAQADTCSQFAQIGRSLLPARRSLASSAAWYDASVSASERSERGQALDAALSGERSLVIPRIPGIDEYLAALEDAVHATVTDKVSSTAALQKAAERWEEITSARGRDQQRHAYQKHLGISDQ